MAKLYDFLPIKASFPNHKKMKLIRKRYKDDPTIVHLMISSLIILWSHCHYDYTDGILGMTGETIEAMVDWQGPQGLFMEIALNKDTTFLEKIGEEEYWVHNLHKHNPHLNPKAQAIVSEQKQRNANAAWLPKYLERLKSNGINIDKCKWLELNEDKKYIKVIYSALPGKIFLEKEQFHSRAEFEECNKHVDNDTKNKRNIEIKKYTKACKKCKNYFINAHSDICFKCESR